MNRSSRRFVRGYRFPNLVLVFIGTAPVLTLSQARRNQLIIAGISSVLLAALWIVGDLPQSMNYALPFVIGALWIPAFLAHKQRDGGVVWNSFFGVLGIAVVGVIVRAVWLIGRG